MENSLSPALLNIYFHELDIFLQNKIIKRYRKGRRATICYEYQKRVAFTREEKRSPEKRRLQLLRDKRKNAHRQNLCNTKINDTHINVRYVRYADDFLLGLQGPRTLAIKIMRTVIFFLKSHLRLTLEDNTPTLFDSFCRMVPYLGMLLYNPIKNPKILNSHIAESFTRKRTIILHKAEILLNSKSTLL
jgi:hypothetical protein